MADAGIHVVFYIGFRNKKYAYEVVCMVIYRDSNVVSVEEVHLACRYVEILRLKA
jgi:hypothetical protein